MKTKIIVLGMVLLLFSYPTILRFCTSPNENYLQAAKETTKPNTNFMFASNASLPGRIYMTFSGEEFKTCINTVTAFSTNTTLAPIVRILKKDQRNGILCKYKSPKLVI